MRGPSNHRNKSGFWMVPLMYRDALQIQYCNDHYLIFQIANFSAAVARYMAQGVKQEYGVSKLSFVNMTGCQQAISK
jgi:hypothetical protein